MEARATFQRAQVPTAPIRVFMAAVLAAFVLGGAGGYVVRGLSGTNTNVTVTTTPFVVEQAPYQSPRPSPIPEPTRDPKGFAVPI